MRSIQWAQKWRKEQCNSRGKEQCNSVSLQMFVPYSVMLRSRRKERKKKAEAIISTHKVRRKEHLRLHKVKCECNSVSQTPSRIVQTPSWSLALISSCKSFQPDIRENSLPKQGYTQWEITSERLDVRQKLIFSSILSQHFHFDHCFHPGWGDWLPSLIEENYQSKKNLRAQYSLLPQISLMGFPCRAFLSSVLLFVLWYWALRKVSK